MVGAGIDFREGAIATPEFLGPRLEERSESHGDCCAFSRGSLRSQSTTHAIRSLRLWFRFKGPTMKATRTALKAGPGRQESLAQSVRLSDFAAFSARSEELNDASR